jgi:hypothetical protein
MQREMVFFRHVGPGTWLALGERMTRLLVVWVLLTSLVGGCANRTRQARGVMAVGAAAVVTGLLVAGACNKAPTLGDGSICSGTPDAKDAKRGMAIVAAGSVLMATGMAMKQGAAAAPPRSDSAVQQTAPGPRAASTPEPLEPTPRMEPTE